jgi:hypothetical protein
VAVPGPTLPPGHPFLNIQSNVYWSATTHAEFPTTAWNMNFSSGFVGFDSKTFSVLVWCVRGGMNADQY